MRAAEAAGLDGCWASAVQRGRRAYTPAMVMPRVRAHRATQRLRWLAIQVAGSGRHGFGPEPINGLDCAWTGRRMVSGCPRSSGAFWRPRAPVGRMLHGVWPPKLLALAGLWWVTRRRSWT